MLEKKHNLQTLTFLTLHILKSVSALFPIHFLYGTAKKNLFTSRELLSVGDHFLYSRALSVLSSGDTVKRN